MRLALSTFILACALTPRSSAQSPAPDPHWGANAFPVRHTELRLGGYFNRFTEFSRSRSRFNQIEESAGFNLFALSYTDRVPGLPDVSFTFTAGAGNASDEPTQWLQNIYVHEVTRMDRVTTGSRRSGAEFLGGLSTTRWWASEDLSRDLFLGAGVVTSSLYHEPYLHLGGTWFFDPIRVGLLSRTSAPQGGEAYPDVATVSHVAQASVEFVPDRDSRPSWLGRLLARPQWGVTITNDSGFFEDASNDAIEIWFSSLHFQWETGLRIETWNDIFNGTDFGPTFGFLVSWDLMTLTSLIR